MSQRFLRPWTRRLAGLILGPGVLWILLRWFEQQQVFAPSRNLVSKPSDLGRASDDLWLTTTDGLRINAWFFPAATPVDLQRPVLLLCHGNAGNLSHRLQHFALLLETGAHVLALDYRGYGLSAGRPCEEGTYLDAQAAYAWLRQRGFAPAQILVLGESMGGGVATELARREPLGGLILQSTFTSIPDLGAEWFPWLPVRWVGRIKFDTHQKLPAVRIPVLVMHSRQDTLISFAHGERNYQAANPPKWFWELHGDHNDSVSEDRNRYLDGLKQFLAATQKPALSP